MTGISPVVVFSHGQESGPWGTKIRAMAKAVGAMDCRAESIDYQGMADPSARVRKLVESCRSLGGPLVFVGSSLGGHVAAAAAAEAGAAGLFVLAPAFYIEEWEDATPAPPDVPIEIVHGWRDDVVPCDNSIRFARECRATLHLLDGDHRLTDNIDEIIYYLTRFLRQFCEARQ